MLYWSVWLQHIHSVTLICFGFFSSSLHVTFNEGRQLLSEDTKPVTGWCRWTWCVLSSRCWSPWRCPQTPRRPWTVGKKDKDTCAILCLFFWSQISSDSLYIVPHCGTTTFVPFQTCRRSQRRTRWAFLESSSWQLLTFAKSKHVSNCILDPNQAWDHFLEVCQCAVRTGSAYVFAVSHHPAVMARDVGVPGLVVNRLPVHQLADAASQGTHAKGPWFNLRWVAIVGLAFALWRLLVVGGEGSCGQVAVFIC